MTDNFLQNFRRRNADPDFRQRLHRSQSERLKGNDREQEEEQKKTLHHVGYLPEEWLSGCRRRLSFKEN